MLLIQIICGKNTGGEATPFYSKISSKIGDLVYLWEHLDNVPYICINRSIGRVSTERLANISVDTRPICRPMHQSSVSRYVDWYIGQGVHKKNTWSILILLEFTSNIFTNEKGKLTILTTKHGLLASCTTQKVYFLSTNEGHNELAELHIRKFIFWPQIWGS